VLKLLLPPGSTFSTGLMGVEVTSASWLNIFNRSCGCWSYSCLLAQHFQQVMWVLKLLLPPGSTFSTGHVGVEVTSASCLNIFNRSCGCWSYSCLLAQHFQQVMWVLKLLLSPASTFSTGHVGVEVTSASWLNIFNRSCGCRSYFCLLAQHFQQVMWVLKLLLPPASTFSTGHVGVEVTSASCLNIFNRSCGCWSSFCLLPQHFQQVMWV
jgi:hypothetical protein